VGHGHHPGMSRAEVLDRIGAFGREVVGELARAF
jgi:hypothetical protein